MRWQLFTVSLLSLSDACGVAVHSYLVERLLPYLPERISRNEAFVRAGAFYPDAFYDCMGQHDAAEEAHWPPFLATGIELVNRRRAFGHDTSELEAFLIGVLTHQVSDVSWHSLGVFQGLLRAMADREFDGNYDEAHQLLDVGGDMIQLQRITSDPTNSNWLNSEWNYNVKDIQELLRANGFPNIPGSSIKYCMTRGKAALGAEVNVANVGYKRFARRSPLLFDQLESYVVGGMTDMQQQIEECVPRFLSWLDGDSLSNAWDLCQVFDGKRHRRRRPQDLEKRKEPNLMSIKGILEIFKDAKSTISSSIYPARATELNCEIVSVPPLEADTKLTAGMGHLRPGFGTAITLWNTSWAVAAASEGKVYIYDENFELSQTLNAKQGIKLPGMFAAQFGQSMAVWKNYLVVANPGISTLDVFNTTGTWIGSIGWRNATTTYGKRGLKLVGMALAVDQDLDVLYVGAPYYDDDTDPDDIIDQAGLVFALPIAVLRRVIAVGAIMLDSHTYRMATGEDEYSRLGSRISITQRFVLVGVPGESQVNGYDYATRKHILTLQDGDDTEPGMTGFGDYVLAGNKDYMVIGSPASTNASRSQAGQLSIYKNTQRRSVGGSAEFEWFGSSGVLLGAENKHTVLLASPHAMNGQGGLWKLDLSSMELTDLGVPPGAADSGFGRAIASNGTTAVVGMPYHHGNSPRLGAVAVVPISSSV